ncbi:MAG: hypothetical protein AAGA60_31160 [Cyanobacteria bacterium P01_E01_bin.42]
MPSSQEFREALQAGKVQEAFTLALTEAVELKITTWVSSSDLDADVNPREATSTIAPRESADEAKPGHRLRTNINLMQGDIEHEIGDRFLNNNAYHELLRFHFTQVDKGQQIIEQNIHSLQKIFSLVTSLKNPPLASASDSPPAAIAPEEAEAESFAEIESTTDEHLFSEDTIDIETAESALDSLGEQITDSVIIAEEEFQQARSEVAPAELELRETEAEELPLLVVEDELEDTMPLFEEEGDRPEEEPESSDNWLEEETPSISVEASPGNSLWESSPEAEETAQTPEITDSETADSQTEAFIDTLFSSDDWIEEDSSENISPAPESAPQNPPTPSESLEIEGWDSSSNLHLSEPISPLSEEIPAKSESDIFQIENLDDLSESEAELDLEDWEFSSEGTENEDERDQEFAADLQSLDIEELTPTATSEADLDALASELTSETPVGSEEDASFTELDNPWDAPEPEMSSLEALSLEEEENTDESDEIEDEEDEDWGDFVKFVEQDLSESEAPPTVVLPETDSQPEPEFDFFAMSEEGDRDLPSPDPTASPIVETAIDEAISLEEDWDPASELDPFATSQSDTESYTSIVEEDWEEFAIEELEPYPKTEESAWQEPFFEETVATASIDEILDDPPELIDEERAELSESELDRAWDEELFGDEFNFDISLSDEADMPSDFLEVEAKSETPRNG